MCISLTQRRWSHVVVTQPQCCLIVAVQMLLQNLFMFFTLLCCLHNCAFTHDARCPYAEYFCFANHHILLHSVPTFVRTSCITKIIPEAQRILMYQAVWRAGPHCCHWQEVSHQWESGSPAGHRHLMLSSSSWEKERKEKSIETKEPMVTAWF